MFSQLKILLAIPKAPVRGRVVIFVLICLILYSATLVGLLIAWYALDTTVPFHWFNDSAGWLFVDKFGHFYIAFIECSILSKVWRWTGLTEKRCILIASGIAFVSQSSYEIFDGFSASYGASATDILANAMGVAVFVMQFNFFKRLFLSLKFSFHATSFAHLRPIIFGDSIIQQILKDYNGQTYWFTFDLNELTRRRVLPSWLFITVGYGGDGMLGGDDNVWTSEDGEVHDYSHVVRTSRVMFSIDFNWSRITNKYVRYLCHIFTYIKFPTPTVEINVAKGFRFHWIYF